MNNQMCGQQYGGTRHFHIPCSCNGCIQLFCQSSLPSSQFVPFENASEPHPPVEPPRCLAVNAKRPVCNFRLFGLWRCLKREERLGRWDVCPPSHLHTSDFPNLTQPLCHRSSKAQSRFSEDNFFGEAWVVRGKHREFIHREFSAKMQMGR